MSGRQLTWSHGFYHVALLTKTLLLFVFFVDTMLHAFTCSKACYALEGAPTSQVSRKLSPLRPKMSSCHSFLIPASMLLQLLILEYMQKADEEILELKYHHVTQIRMIARGAKREKKEEKTRRILSTLI